MGLPLLDLLVALFFLLSLVVVARFRNEIRAHDRESYNYLSGGLAVLAVVALIRIYGGVGLFTTFPFLSDPLFFKVLGWIGIITGATFVVSGVSTWLPLARSHRKYGMERVQRLELIKKVEQLAMVDSRLSEIMSTTLDYMVALPDFSWGAVYSCTGDTGHSTLVTTSGAVEATTEALRHIEYQGVDFCTSKQPELPAVKRVQRKLPPSMATPSLIMPLEVNDRIYGAFLLWAAARDSSIGDEVRVNLKIAVDIIARKIDLDHRRFASQMERRRRSWRNNLAEAVDYSKDLRDNFTAIARLIGRRLETPFVSLAIRQDDGLVRRLTVGASRTLLDEIGLDLCVEGSHVDHVLRSGQPMILNRLTAHDDHPVDDLSMAGSIGSVLAVPVTCRRRSSAVLTVVSSNQSDFDAEDHKLLESAVPIVRGLILDEQRHHSSQESRRRMTSLTDLVSQASSPTERDSLFQAAADTVAAELHCSMVRIGTFNRDEAFMSSRAVVHDPSVTPATPSDGHLILSLMPMHQLVRESGRVVMVNAEDTEHTLTPPEAGQAFFAKVQSAMLVPIMMGLQAVGVIAVGDDRPREKHRYGQSDVLFVRAVTATLALALLTDTGRIPTMAEGRAGRLSTPLPGSPQVRGRIKSSLSGILGSVEMIKSHRKSSDPALEKYLSIIDKSAQRINDCFIDQT